MKKIIGLIFSPRTTILLLLIFAAAIGTATFIEEKYDTETAQQVIYNAKWFEFVILLLVLNFIGNIKRHNMLSRKKLASFVFHAAFIVIILGAAITRYTGFTGTMHIREGEACNFFYTTSTYLNIETPDKKTYDHPIHLSKLTSNAFSMHIDTKDKGPIDINFRDVMRNVRDTVMDNVAGGASMLELVVPGENGRVAILLKEGEIKDVGKFAIAFNNSTKANAVNISLKDGVASITTPFEIRRTMMAGMLVDTILSNTPKEFKERCLYETPMGVFVCKKIHAKAKAQLIAGPEDEKGGPDALLLDVVCNGKKHEAQVIGGSGYIYNYQDFDIDGYNLRMAYGEKEVQLPFQLFLNDFILERYPGSQSPSSFASEVTLIDNNKGIKEGHRIFMNNVLDYGGYRFFQTSYDPDEKGTILSVNHDFWGTWVTYAGYFLLGLGFLITLVSKGSRFQVLSRSIRKAKAVKNAVPVAALLALLVMPAYSQNMGVSHISKEAADKFGHLVVQTIDGRFEPVHTLAFDAMHKISRKDAFDVEGQGKMDAMQVFVDMMLNGEFWKTQKIVYVREKAVQDLLGITGSYASFNDFFDEKNNYKLGEVAEKSFRKKQSEQNTFDKEIIKVDERANVCMMVINGSMLKIFPVQNSENNSWTSWNDSLAHIPLTGSLKMINEDLQLREFNYTSLMGVYLQELYKGTKTGDYSKSDKILNYVNTIQRQGPSANVIPSKERIDLEIHYNNSKVFEHLRNWYAMISLVMLVLAFIDVLREKKSKIVVWALNIGIVLLVLAFAYHTYGMILRWYLTGHAPWSTGYEALLLIGWGGLLAGFAFIRTSKIVIAATALLAFFVLMTAGHSNYDPQLTNLQPVLKSYWLIIHVATLTISYGFLGLGFVLGLFNLLLYLAKNQKNAVRLNAVTHQLTNINEMNLTIGLFLATVGTFLGGIWANESWGKYWGWDAKETWALVIVITYTVVLHLRLVSKLKGEFLFNVGAVIAYGSVLMTFFGVNYYLSKGLHSYAAGEKQVFPTWAWISIVSVVLLIVISGQRHKAVRKKMESVE